MSRFRRYGAVLRTGARVDRPLATELALTSVIAALCLAARALWFKLLVDTIIDGDVDGTTVIAVVLGVSDAVRSLSQVRGQMALQDMRDKATQHFNRERMQLAGAVPGVAHFEDPVYADRLEEYRVASGALAGAVATVVDAIALVLRAVATLALLAWVHPALVVLPVFALPAIGAGRRSQKALQDGQAAVASPTALLQHLFGILTRPAAAIEARILGLTGELRSRERGVWRSITLTQQRAQVRSQAIAFAGWLVFGVGYVGAIVFVAAEATRGAATAGDLLLTVILAGQVNMMVQQGAMLVGSFTAIDRALELHDWLAGLTAGRAGGEAPPERLASGITVEHATVRYSGDQPALDDVSVELEAGTTVAVVGENGAGKTTFVKALCGFYPLDSGRILVDGVDLDALDPKAWRARIAAGFQDFTRFEVLARETVGLGDLARIDDGEAVAGATERASATEVVDGLPQRFDTQLGSQFEAGVDLSGGQWQRLAVARAMMRATPLLVLLDEPTAAIDAVTEQALFERYAEAARAAARRGAVTVLVSHRFSTVRMADQIIVLDRGKVVATGSHQQLMAQGGLYREMYEVQEASYR